MIVWTKTSRLAVALITAPALLLLTPAMTEVRGQEILEATFVNWPGVFVGCMPPVCGLPGGIGLCCYWLVE